MIEYAACRDNDSVEGDRIDATALRNYLECRELGWASARSGA
jgi:hypothetical protein